MDSNRVTSARTSGEDLDRCAAVRELLPWLANGSLEAGERSDVERHLERCPQCRGELAELRETWRLFAHRPSSKDLVDTFFASALEDDARRRAADERIGVLRRWSESDRRLADELAMVEASLNTLRAQEDAGPEFENSSLEDQGVPISSRRLASKAVAPRTQVPWLAAAAGLLTLALSLTAVSWWTERGRTVRLEAQLAQLVQPRLNTVTVDVLPDDMILRGNQSGASASVSGLRPTGLELRPGQDLTLILSYPRSDPPAAGGESSREYAVRLVGPDDFVWEIEGLVPNPTQDFTLSFPPGFLVPGEYQLEIYLPEGERDPAGVLRLESRYRFAITRPEETVNR